MRIPVVVVALATTACLEDLSSPDFAWRGSAGGRPNDGKGVLEDVRPPAGAQAAPDFGATTRAQPAPPPLSGGTLAAVPGRKMVVAADPDRDLVYVIDVEHRTSVTVPLSPGDEPGRVVVDDSLRAHVALRGGASLATIDLANGNAVNKRAVCTLPRGVAWEKQTDEVHVACADGELVTLAASGGPPKRTVRVARDLRDVVVTRHGLVVSTFRNGHVMRLAKDGSVDAQSAGPYGSVVQRVAWRMLASPYEPATAEDPGASVMMAAQQTPSELSTPPPTPPAYYEAESGCAAGGPVALLTDRRRSLTVPNAVLPVDIATDGTDVLVVAAANAHLPTRSQIIAVDRELIGTSCAMGAGIGATDAEITSIVYLPSNDRFYALSREPAALYQVAPASTTVFGQIPLSSVSKRDTGHAIFHASSGRGGTACASCHPEGRDDGHSWRSQSLGARRTPSLLGTVAGTAPYHWNGEAQGLSDLMTMTFTNRMLGPALADDQKEAIGSWLVELPPLRRPSTSISLSAALTRGRAIFESATARCASCHTGSRLTNNATVDVGTGGGAMQVPSLVSVVHRAPYLHDGSRPHLRSVLYAPHGGASVRADEVDDLVTYLESL